MPRQSEHIFQSLSLVAGLEAQFQHMMQEFWVDQHVEADGCHRTLALDERAADLIADTENFEEEVVRHFDAGIDFQNCARKRDRADEAADLLARGQMMADTKDAAGAIQGKLFKCPVRLRQPECRDNGQKQSI